MSMTMKKSIVMLLIEAAGLADGFYSKSYVRELETYSPFRFSFLRKHRCRLRSHRASLMRVLEEYVASGDSTSSEAA